MASVVAVENKRCDVLNREEKLVYWSEVIKRFENSSLNQTKFCQKERISLSSFHKWRSRLQAHQRTQQSSQSTMAFARIHSPIEGPLCESVTLELPNRIKLSLKAGSLSSESLALIRSLMKEI